MASSSDVKRDPFALFRNFVNEMFAESVRPYFTKPHQESVADIPSVKQYFDSIGSLAVVERTVQVQETDESFIRDREKNPAAMIMRDVIMTEVFRPLTAPGFATPGPMSIEETLKTLMDKVIEIPAHAVRPGHIEPETVWFADPTTGVAQRILTIHMSFCTAATPKPQIAILAASAEQADELKAEMDRAGIEARVMTPEDIEGHGRQVIPPGCFYVPGNNRIH